MRLQRDFIAGQMCQATPKLAICPNRDGTTWAKMAWRRTAHDSERVEVSINLHRIEDTMEGAMRLGDYAIITLKGRPEALRWGNKPVRVKPEAHYIWAGKWPHLVKNAWANVNLADVHPPDVYRPPEIWDWIAAPGVLSEAFQRTIPNAVFEELGNSQINFGNDEVANSNAENLAMNYRWPPVKYDIPRVKAVKDVKGFFNRIGTCEDSAGKGKASTGVNNKGSTGGKHKAVTGEKDKGSTGGKDKDATGEKVKGATRDNDEDINTSFTHGHGSDKDETETRKQICQSPTRYCWKRTRQTEPEKVMIPPSAAAKREKRAVIDGWKHQGIIPPPKRFRPVQNRIPFPPKMRSHADAYLTIGPPHSRAAEDDGPSRAHFKNKRKAYLASLLQNMSGAWTKDREGQVIRAFHPGTGHFHHHHRPTKIIEDHRWRLNYFVRIEPNRFPWPPSVEKTLTVMMDVCEEIRERKQNKDPADAIEWRNFGHLLELGDKVTMLWETTPLESRQTMRCLNGKCEHIRVSYLEFEGKAIKAKEWNLLERYQRWMYGAEQCPADCPLRAFDCPINCGLVHRNPIDIFSADFAVLADIGNLPLTDTQKSNVIRVLDETYPSRWLGPPPIHWMPVRADPGFWDHRNQSSTALTARIDACENRLFEWEVLSDNERRAIMNITNIYYDDINDVIDNAGWAIMSQNARRLAREEEEIREAYPNDVKPPQVIDKNVLLYMSRKTDRIEEDYPPSKRRLTTHEFYLQKIPKVTIVDFENRLTFRYLREFW